MAEIHSLVENQWKAIIRRSWATVRQGESQSERTSPGWIQLLSNDGFRLQACRNDVSAKTLLNPRSDIDMPQPFDSPGIPKNHSSPARWQHDFLKRYTNQMITPCIQCQCRILGLITYLTRRLSENGDRSEGKPANIRFYAVGLPFSDSLLAMSEPYTELRYSILFSCLLVILLTYGWH